MSVGLNIQLSPQAEKVVQNFQTLPARFIAAIARGMDQANALALSNIQAKHLTGVGPFPPAEHRLGEVTHQLKQTSWASPSKPVGETAVQSAIGSNVKYAAIHEFGGRIHHQPRQAKVRHRLDARGNLVKQALNSNLLVFASSAHKRARETTVDVPEYDVIMPERAPFRTGLKESAGDYKTQISAAILAEWKKGSTS